jgi:hypothetical protein
MPTNNRQDELMFEVSYFTVRCDDPAIAAQVRVPKRVPKADLDEVGRARLVAGAIAEANDLCFEDGLDAVVYLGFSAMYEGYLVYVITLFRGDGETPDADTIVRVEVHVEPEDEDEEARE